MRTTTPRNINRLSLAVMALLTAAGCAGPLAPASTELTDIRNQASCRWLPKIKAANEALEASDTAGAEERFKAALLCAERLPAAKARIRTSLGGLVRVAVTHQLAGDPVEAERVMRSLLPAVTDLRLEVSVAQALIEPCQARYDQRTSERARNQRLLSSQSGHRRPAHPSSLERLILAKAHSHDVDPALVKAVVAAESNFDNHAVSRAGAKGLMQLMPQTAHDLGVYFPFDPAQNLEGGVRYLRAMLDRFGNTGMALAAYNAGPEAVVRYGGIPPYPETQEYVERVLQFYATYRDDLLN